MAIKDIVSLCAALIGSTAAVLAAWSYIRTNHPPRGELFRALMIITITIVGILGFAVFISRATTITVNGQDTVPGLSTPHQTAPAYFPMRTPSPSPSATSSPSVTPSPSPSVTPLASPTVTVTPSSTATPSTTATPSSSPTVTPSATP